MTKKETIKDGLHESFYKNGQLKFRGNYKVGKRDNLWEWFHENGQPKQRGNYKDGKRDGLWKVFDVTSNNNPFVLHGPIKYRGNYKVGRRDGLSEWFDENGQLESSICYKEGNKKKRSYCED